MSYDDSTYVKALKKELTETKEVLKERAQELEIWRERAWNIMSSLWHNLKEDPNDLPKETGWYVCKVKGSDDLHLVYGYENVTLDRFDAWLEIYYCPF